MDRKDLKRAGFICMLILLTMSAPQWLNPANQSASTYEAPWIYPGLEPVNR
ncbi:MAG: hypothetical protein K2W82_08920 [Candidatus Obscuribacterales bacterium]|nr:hypothetical protein [Candidatus Obscuribacterales bacterium]